MKIERLFWNFVINPTYPLSPLPLYFLPPIRFPESLNLFHTHTHTNDSIHKIDPFREPVPWKTLGLKDYPKIIKNPMDLGFVKKKLCEEKYDSINEAVEDVRLIWKNCKLYNADDSDIYHLAQVRKR